jgi:hypothetical protein
MRWFLDKYIYLSQPIMLLTTIIYNFFIFNNIGAWVVGGNIIGFSLLTNLMLFYLFNFKGRYCWFTRNCYIFLSATNILDIIGWLFLDDCHYFAYYNIGICVIAFALFIINHLEKKKYD